MLAGDETDPMPAYTKLKTTTEKKKRDESSRQMPSAYARGCGRATRSSCTSSHETGTIRRQGTARRAHTAPKVRPHSKEPP